jgi:hypothetical protein
MSASPRAIIKTEQGPLPHYGKKLRPFDPVAYPACPFNRTRPRIVRGQTMERVTIMTPTLAALGYDETTRIRFLNDMLRSTGAGGNVMITRGIQALSDENRCAILQKVRSFDAFTEDNDPYQEHDFGSFLHNGVTINWKIDYYDPSLKFGSEDPSDDEKTARILTIILAEEY